MTKNVPLYRHSFIRLGLMTTLVIAVLIYLLNKEKPDIPTKYISIYYIYYGISDPLPVLNFDEN